MSNSKACTVAFMKAKNSSVAECREKRVNWKKTENGENIFQANLKANQPCQRTAKLLMHNLLSNGLHEKVVICYLKQIRCTVCQENLHSNDYWAKDERRGV